jgi:hypothetical protein
MEDYLHNITKVIMASQFVEQALKQYIFTANTIINTQTKHLFPYKFTEKSIDEASLGKLINIFENLNYNQKLIDKLKKYRPIRNIVFHEGFVVSDEAQQDTRYIKSRTAQLVKIHAELKTMMQEISEETKKIRQNNKP